MGSVQRHGAFRFAAWCVVGLALAVSSVAADPAPQDASSLVEHLPPPTTPPPSPYGIESVRAFMDAASKADRISDPMERCLHYPDPPGAHWSREGVAAYCHFALQSTVDMADFDRLIASGHADELDKRFAALEADPAHHPEAFWAFLKANFDKGDQPRQRLIESWKQQCPKSAYAYTLSGWNYLGLGWSARGGSSHTSDRQIETAAALFDRGRGDLEMAMRLDPNLTTPYAALISAGTVVSDEATIEAAVKKGLRATGGKAVIFTKLAQTTSTRWGGTPEAREWLLSQVRQSIDSQPLLHIIPPMLAAYEAHVDYMAPADGDWSVLGKVYSDVSTVRLLRLAAQLSYEADQPAVAYVYLSEASRFGADDAWVMQARTRSASRLSGPLLH